MILHRAAVLATTVQETCLALGPPHFSANGQPVKKEIQNKKNKRCAKIQQLTSDELNNKEVLWEKVKVISENEPISKSESELETLIDFTAVFFDISRLS